jgi:hypothetical protein
MSRAAPKNISERLDLDSIIRGLVGDLKEFRAGKISSRDARIRAELAREILRGVRLVIEAQKFMEGRALPAPQSEG